MMNDIIVRNVITELFRAGVLTPKDYVKFMRYTTQMSDSFVFDKLESRLEKMEKEETKNDKT